MAKEFIVAIELGSSKITGIAGKKNQDGSMDILAIAQEDSTTCIRKGVVYNIDKTTLCLTNIVKKLETKLKTKITQVYVGIGGQSIKSIRNNIFKDLPEDSIVTQEMINELMDDNRNMSYPDQEILDAITQEYKVGNQYQISPVGIQCSRLEGNFLNILWRKTFYRNLNKCLEDAGIVIADMYLSPIVLANSVLTEAEKRGGCILVDLGAETTTVAVYYKNILRHLSVVPLGGYNITKDLASLQMDEDKAEQLKISQAKAITDSDEIDENVKIPIGNGREIDQRTFCDVVEARVQEIIINAWYQVPSDFNDKLTGGIILTGGAANMPEMEKAFHTYIPSVEKIRTAKFVQQKVNSTNQVVMAHDGRLNAVLGLLATGNTNCAGEEIDDNLFSQEPPKVVTEVPSGEHPSVEGGGVNPVKPMPAPPKKADEKENEVKEQPEKEKNGLFHKLMKAMKKFGGDIFEPEE